MTALALATDAALPDDTAIRFSLIELDIPGRERGPIGETYVEPPKEPLPTINPIGTRAPDPAVQRAAAGRIMTGDGSRPNTSLTAMDRGTEVHRAFEESVANSYPDAAVGDALDILAMSVAGIERVTGETDAQLRNRATNALMVNAGMSVPAFVEPESPTNWQRNFVNQYLGTFVHERPVTESRLGFVLRELARLADEGDLGVDGVIDVTREEPRYRYEREDDYLGSFADGGLPRMSVRTVRDDRCRISFKLNGDIAAADALREVRDMTRTVYR